jgi:catechol-2,3-dioxygenase
MVYVYAVHMSSGTGHQHIASVRWRNPDSGESGQSTREVMVDWIRNKQGKAYVCGGHGHMAVVGVVDAASPYIRTYADGVWTDNLLALPRY